MTEPLESILQDSCERLITLNTRISKQAADELLEIQGYLQAESPLAKITKQSAVDWVIKAAYFYMQGRLKEIDSLEVIPTEKTPTKANNGVLYLATANAETLITRYALESPLTRKVNA